MKRNLTLDLSSTDHPGNKWLIGECRNVMDKYAAADGKGRKQIKRDIYNNRTNQTAIAMKKAPPSRLYPAVTCTVTCSAGGHGDEGGENDEGDDSQTPAEICRP